MVAVIEPGHPRGGLCGAEEGVDADGSMCVPVKSASGTRRGFSQVDPPMSSQAGQNDCLDVLADVGVPIARCLFTAKDRRRAPRS